MNDDQKRALLGYWDPTYKKPKPEGIRPLKALPEDEAFWDIIIKKTIQYNKSQMNFSFFLNGLGGQPDEKKDEYDEIIKSNIPEFTKEFTRFIHAKGLAKGGSLDNAIVVKGNEIYKLYSGVPVAVGIITGRRSFLDYFLSPFLNKITFSLSER